MNNPWDERYTTDDYIYGTEPNDFLREHAPSLLNDREQPHVLCVADGEGRNSVYLAGLGATVCAMDISQVGLEKAQQLAQQRGVSIQTQCVDLTEALLPEQHYDGVVAIFCHLPSAGRAHLYEQIAASLKPGGFFLLEGYSQGQLKHTTGGPGKTELLLNCAELTRAFKGFTIALNQDVEREIHEGDRHSGLGAVCQFIATKPTVRDQRYQFTANRSKASHKLRYVESSASTDGDCTLCKGPLTSDD